MIIDNMNGFWLSGMPFADMDNVSSGLTFYQAQYWLDSKDCECGPVSVRTTLVNIASTYTGTKPLESKAVSRELDRVTTRFLSESE